MSRSDQICRPAARCVLHKMGGGGGGQRPQIPLIRPGDTSKFCKLATARLPSNGDRCGHRTVSISLILTALSPTICHRMFLPTQGGKQTTGRPPSPCSKTASNPEGTSPTNEQFDYPEHRRFNFKSALDHFIMAHLVSTQII